MIELRQTTTRLFLRLFVAALFLFPAFIYAQKPPEMLPQKYADSEAGDIHSLQQMLKEGISINAVDENGRSLLMLAARSGDMQKVKFLIDAGADINQRNGSSILTLENTPLDYAIVGKHKEIVDLFLSLNVDVNARFRGAMSTIHKCGMTHNYEMLHYLLQKGVVVSDEDKINTMILALPDGNALMSQESWQIIQLFLQGLEVEADDLWKSSFLKRGNTRDVKRVEKILAIQESDKDTKRKETVKQREQDSLNMLLKSGQADTIHYNYMVDMISGSNAWKGEITVTPRVDYAKNEQGNKSSAVFWILLGLTALVAYYCCQQIVTHVFKERGTNFFLYIAIYLIGGWMLYSIFSCIYRNLDDIMVRKQGEEKIAVLDSECSLRQYRSGGKYDIFLHKGYSFVFTGNDSIRIAIEQGNTCFDVDDYLEEGRSHIKVRYDSASRKLSVDNDRYFMQNLIWISFMGLLLLLIFMFCWGVFNDVLDAISRKLDPTPKNYQPKITYTKLNDCAYEEGGNFIYYSEDPSIDTFWTFTSKEYLLKDDFIRDVQQSEEQNGAKPDKRIHPDKILFDFRNVSVYFSDEFTIGEENLCIEITFDNGINITESELLFRLHNQVIPYLDRLSKHTIVQVLSMGYWTKNHEVECAIIFKQEED